MREWLMGLQVLRGILFVMVFVSHSSAFLNAYGYLGSMGVSAFFVLSGFLASYKYKSLGNSRGLIQEQALFVFNRVKKFYPLYFCLLILALFMNPSTPANFFKCLFLVQSYWGEANVALSYNWPTWFLSSILLCYFIAPIFNRVLIKIKRGWIHAFIIVVLFAMMADWSYIWRYEPEALGRGYYFVYIFPVARLLDFAIGACMGRLFIITEQIEENEEKKYLIGSFYEIIAVLLFIGLQTVSSKIPLIYTYTVVWLPVSIALVWVFAKESGFMLNCSRNVNCSS